MEPMLMECSKKKYTPWELTSRHWVETAPAGKTPAGRTANGSLRGYLFLLRRSVIAK
jgi:hypothetical protein